VVNIHTIKPIDKNLIVELSKTHDIIITCEEHNVIGGLGSAVSEVLAPYNGAKQYMIGIEDTFGESGTPDELLNKYGICASNIVKKVREVI
ncbi:transketolase C-terminal domain-containing protein, partial [Clostridium perfringens]